MTNHELKHTSLNQDNFFYDEMMAHPALFTHPAPKKIALIGDYAGILSEVLKHPNVQTVHCVGASAQEPTDNRVRYLPQTVTNWLATPHNTYDIMIQTQPALTEIPLYQRLLESDGILIMPLPSSLLDISTLRIWYDTLTHIGFPAIQTLNFAQPSCMMGWRLLLMATKLPAFRRVREKEVFNRHFETRYYNYDIHKAALALPEFVSFLFQPDGL